MREGKEFSFIELGRWRLDAGYNSQSAAARMLGWSRSRLNNYETGYSTPDIDTLALLAKLYKCKVDDFLV